MLLFLISSKGSFMCTITEWIAYTTFFDTPVMEHWLEQEITVLLFLLFIYFYFFPFNYLLKVLWFYKNWNSGLIVAQQ